MIRAIKRCAAVSAIAMTCVLANAIPPMPGFIKVAQPDGTTVEARIEGNRDFHYYVTREGKRLVTDADGFLKATELTDEQLRAKVTEATVARIDAEVRAK